MPEPACTAFRFDLLNLHAAASAPALRLFSDVMRFKRGWRSPSPFPRRWFHDEHGQPALHSLDAPASHGDGIQIGHIAFRVDEIADSVLTRLDAAGLSCKESFAPKASDVQTFVLMLGGLVVELNTPADPARPSGVDRSGLARATIAVKTLPTSQGRSES